MSLHHMSRTPLLRRGLVALATSAALLAGGLVVAPSAQSSSLPVVDVHRSQGTTVTTSMYASGSVITGDVERQKLYPAEVGYTVSLAASGGTMLGAEVEVTVQKVNSRQVRKRTIEMKRTTTGYHHGLPEQGDPGVQRGGHPARDVPRGRRGVHGGAQAGRHAGAAPRRREQRQVGAAPP
ncbi:hypothetical protein [Promicromonospora sp. NPDC019610]|uniref:hypothetical protein n=1 Tax=Promicromonospora sp. NPDC019610 TaxID=3364405 RepID=UPI0037991D7A